MSDSSARRLVLPVQTCVVAVEVELVLKFCAGYDLGGSCGRPASAPTDDVETDAGADGDPDERATFCAGAGADAADQSERRDR
ncbi:hypothetical protein P9209_15865 [Prescottella defluvii]|nr:hypothetical protein P9209_15865 [Prescottella defluvii]